MDVDDDDRSILILVQSTFFGIAISSLEVGQWKILKMN
jgi:hypothetical protein